MLVSAAQIRAARGLLDWTRENLANAAGLSASTIRNLEKGNISPRGATASGLARAFDKAGVVFPPEGGVRQERPDVKIVEGRESANVLFESLLHTVKKRSGEILGVFGSQMAILQALGLEIDESKRRLEMLKRHAKLKWLLSDMATDTQSRNSQGELRSVSRLCVGPEARLDCGNKHVLIYNIGQSDHRTIIINDPRISIASKDHFYDLWEISTPLSLFMPREIEEVQASSA